MSQLKLPTWKADDYCSDNPCLHLILLTTISNFSRFLGGRCLCSNMLQLGQGAQLSLTEGSLT